MPVSSIRFLATKISLHYAREVVVMKKSFFTMLVVAVAAGFMLTACGGGSGGGPVPVDEGTTSPVYLGVIDPSISYAGQVGPWSATTGISYYYFQTTTSVQYTIGLTNTTADLGWWLWDSSGSSVMQCDSPTPSPVDEICTTPTLDLNALYVLEVWDFDPVGSFFTLTVSR